MRSSAIERAVIGALAMLLLLPASLLAQDYPTEEIQAPWAVGDTIEMLLSDVAGLSGMRDGDFCRFMSAALSDEEPAEDQLARCAGVLGRATQAWLPESMLDLVAPPTPEVAESVRTIRGRFILRDKTAGWQRGKPCRGRLGYADIGPRTQVKVRDDEGKLLAATQLGQGTRTKPGKCAFSYTLPNLPEAEFYELESGRRGAVAYSFDDLEDRGWRVTLTLG